MKANRVEHGGGLGNGRRKVARPLSTRRPIYVVLCSTRAKGQLSLARPEMAAKVKVLVHRQAERCRIELIQFINEGSTLHFLMRVPSRAAYLRFIRSVCGLISRQVTGAQRGPAMKAAHGRVVDRKKVTLRTKTSASQTMRNRFWDVLPYSRIVDGVSTISAARKQLDENVRRELLASSKAVSPTQRVRRA